MALTVNLNDVQHEPIIVTASLTAALNRYYVNTVTSTYTDPTPVQGKGFIVFVRNGTATVGGTAYGTVGTLIYRYFHSGAWANTVVDLSDEAITGKLLTGGTFVGSVTDTMTILQALENIDSNLSQAVFEPLPNTQIYIGNSVSAAIARTLSLNASGGTFGLGNTGILTMPNAATGTRGLLTSTDWNTFNNKGDALVVNPLSQFAATTSAQLAGVISDETGTDKLVFNTSPTFATQTSTTAITATTSSNDILQTLTNNSSGTPAASYGLSRLIQLKSTTTASQTAGKEIWSWSTATHASRQSQYAIQLVGNASVGNLQDAFKIVANGNSFKFQFVNHIGYDPRVEFLTGTAMRAYIENSGDNLTFNTVNSSSAYFSWRAGLLTNAMRLSTTGLFIGGDIAATAILDLVSGTTAKAQIRFRSSTAPTTPNDGDMWYDGTDWKVRTGGVTKTVVLV